MKRNLTDKVKEFNQTQRYTQKIKAKAVAKAQLEHLIEEAGKGIKKAIHSIPEIPNKIREYQENREMERIEEEYIFDLYNYFLIFAKQSEKMTGIEQTPDESVKFIYTDFGPLSIVKLDELTGFQNPIERQNIEGFMPDDDGLLRYFKVDSHTQKNNPMVTLIGYTIDPETMKISWVNKTTHRDKCKALFYIRKQEELARKKSNNTQASEFTNE